MAMINLPTAPTNPALGKSSSAINQGYIDSELQPFIKMGGAITQDPGSLSFAGQARLGRHIFLRSPEEQQKIMGEMKNTRLNQFVNERLGEGFSKASASRLQRKEGGLTRFLDIDWGTGNINETTLNDATGSTSTRRVETDPLVAKSNVLKGIESGKIRASSAATENLKVQLGLSTPAASPQYYDIGGQGYSVSSDKVQNMANQITNNVSKNSGSSSSSSSSKTTSTPSYSNGGIAFSGNSYSNVNVSSNLSKAMGTSTAPSTNNSIYKVSTPSVYSTPTTKTTSSYAPTPVTVKAPTQAQKVTATLKTALSNTKIGQATKAISSLLKKK